MTERTPFIPEPLDMGTNNQNRNNQKVKPNPRTVRATDFTWFNTCGSNIIKTDYNKCTGDIKKHQFPWGQIEESQNVPFNLEPWGEKKNSGKCDMFSRFDLYGLSSKCSCNFNRCGCDKKPECPLFKDSYVNPN